MADSGGGKSSGNLGSEEKDGKSGKGFRALAGIVVPAAVVGAFVSFAGTAFGAKSEAAKGTPLNTSLVQMDFLAQKQSAMPLRLDLEYAQTLVLGAVSPEQRFRRSISAIAIGSADQINVLGDGEVRTFDSKGIFLRKWKAPEGALCMAVGGGGRVYSGRAGQVEIYSTTGIREGGFGISIPNVSICTLP